MRKFAFVVFDIDNSIIDRFPLDVVTDLSGLGWRLKLSKIEGDVTDTVTKVVQEKQSVGITINLIGRGYHGFTAGEMEGFAARLAPFFGSVSLRGV